MKYDRPTRNDIIGMIFCVVALAGAIVFAIYDGNRRDEKRKNTEYIYTVNVDGVIKSFSSFQYETGSEPGRSLIIHLDKITCLVANQYTVTTVDHSKVEK